MNFSVPGVGILLNYFFPVFSFIKLYCPSFLIHLLLQQKKINNLIKDSEDLWFWFLGKKQTNPKMLSCYGVCRWGCGHAEVPEDEMVLASDKKKGKKFMEPSAGLAPLQRMEDAEATLDPEAC